MESFRDVIYTLLGFMMNLCLQTPFVSEVAGELLSSMWAHSGSGDGDNSGTNTEGEMGLSFHHGCVQKTEGSGAYTWHHSWEGLPCWKRR